MVGISSNVCSIFHLFPICFGIVCFGRVCCCRLANCHIQSKCLFVSVWMKMYNNFFLHNSKNFGFENVRVWKFYVPQFLFRQCRCVCVFVASISLFVVLMQFKWLNCTQRFAYLCVRVMYGDFGVVYSPNMYMNVSYIWNLSLRLSMLGLYTTENVQTLGKYWRLAWKLGPNFSKQAS